MAEKVLFPTCRYHADGRVILVASEDDLKALAGEWSSTPIAPTPIAIYVEDEPDTLPNHGSIETESPESTPPKRGPGRPRKVR